MIKSIFNAAKLWGQQQGDNRAGSAHLQGYAGRLSMMLADLNLDAAELSALESQRSALGITDAQANTLHASAFAHIASRVMADGTLTEPELDGLHAIRNALGLRWDKLPPPLLRTLQTAATVLQVSSGTLPTVPASQSRIQLGEAEVLHCEIPVRLLDERTIARQYRGARHGVSFPIYKGIRYHLGGTRGRSVPQTAIVVVDSGRLSITSVRIVYVGDRKNFSMPWPKVLSAEPLSGGLRVAFVNRATPWSFQYGDPSASELFAAIVSHYIS